MYSKYAYGVPDTSKNEYDFLVKRDTYDAGIQLRNDTTSSSTGKKGVRISHSSSDNANVDLRGATGATNSFSFRLQDDAAPTNFSSMMTLTDDDKSKTSAYGMTVGGRTKASQYFVGESDTRAPVSTGLYLGHDANTVGYINLNRGANGTGGFKFNTYAANGVDKTVNLSLDRFGFVAAPKYSATNDALDSEASSAIVSFDSTGKLVRDFQQNARLRSHESRATKLESTDLPSISTKVNEIISRMNAVAFFNSNIAAMDLGSAPLPYTAPSASVSLNMNVDLTTAYSPTFQQGLIQSTATALGVNQSQVSIGSITTGTGSNIVSSSAASASDSSSLKAPAIGGGVNIEIIVAPDPTGTVKINPTVAVQQLAVQAQSASSPFVAALVVATGASNPVNTNFVPVTKVVPTNTPAPTTPAPTTPPPAITARYIKLKHGTSSATHRYLNLFGIKVYTNEGYNVIKPTTVTTASSVYQNDVNSYGSAKLVDNSEATHFLSNQTEPNPWAQIDLGSDLTIYKVELVNRSILDSNALKCYDRSNGLVVECINNAGTSVYTSLPVYNKNDSTTYSTTTLDGYKFFACWPSKSTTMYCTDEHPSYVLDPNVVTVKNYTTFEAVVDKYSSAGYTWTAPVDCKILSANFYVSGAVNNNGFAAGDINTSAASNSTGGRTLPTAIGVIDWYELVKAWNIPAVSAGQTVNFSFTTMESYRYFKILQLAGNALPVKFSYIPIASIITPAPPTYPPPTITSSYRIKWINTAYVFRIDSTVTNPQGNNVVSYATGDMYTLPAGTYSWTASGRNDSNDWCDFTFFDVDANAVVATLITAIQPWTNKSGSGTFTLSSQKTFQCRITNGYYAYNTNFDITLTRS